MVEEFLGLVASGGVRTDLVSGAGWVFSCRLQADTVYEREREMRVEKKGES